MALQTTTPSWENRLFALAQESLPVSAEAAVLKARREFTHDLEEAIAATETITAEHSRSFHLATGLLPREKRQAMRVLYAFCRVADNLADEDIDQPEINLRHLRANTLGDDKSTEDPVLKAWANVQERYRIPARYAEQLLDGVERDLVQQRYQTFDDLSVYCYGVASTVGLMSMHISGYTDPRAIPYAIKLGVALQLTNILRDVGEDWQSGRLYLPAEEMEAFGLAESDVETARVDERWRDFMRFQIARARRLYTQAIPGIGLLHPDGRLAVASAAFLYRGILDDIERHDYDVFNRRAFVSRRFKLAALARAFIFAKRRIDIRD